MSKSLGIQISYLDRKDIHFYYKFHINNWNSLKITEVTIHHTMNGFIQIVTTYQMDETLQLKSRQREKNTQKDDDSAP